MKKILSLGIASAVLAMTALSASAAVTVSTTDEIKTGATIKVIFTADAAIKNGEAVGFTVKASGVKLEKYEVAEAGSLADIGDSGKFGLVARRDLDAGYVMLTQTYTITATEGQAVSISVDALEGFTDASVTGIAVNITAATTSSDTTSSTTTSSDTTSSSTTSSTTSSDTTSSTTSSTTNPSTNPNTGVALAVFPAVIAGAAVVVAKKKRG